MSNKISHARIEELQDKLRRRNNIEAEIQTVQAKMQELKDKISNETEAQLLSSSTAVRAARQMESTSLSLQDEVDALDINIKRLKKAKAEIQDEIDLLRGWG
ncbi:hypothetical protein J3458_013159 [Metarhizium acridum]|uniref:uncharacterized protein n=1 Tax=Metarhizium acridum TaxID=92637 RepID=UPI001C6C7612|nr:hypothetical protein J3458_013159 [Metarhizium acridum]